MTALFALTCAFFVATATVSNAALLTLTVDQKQGILDAHNRLRSQTALGLTPGQPSAANMPALEWDDRLMDTAGNWVQSCIVGHDKNRVLPGYSWVGQNWAGGYSSNFSSYVQLWFNEYKDYKLEGNSCSAVCGHYTQVVSATTTLVGCAVAQCSSYPYHMVCNYAFGGNYGGNPPYVSGPSGSKCQADYSFKQRGLCLRKDQCSGSDCTCTLKASCINGGTFDAANCKCNCPAGFFGDTCEGSCVDKDPSTCTYNGDAPCPMQEYLDMCPKTCNACRSKLPRDPLVVNRDGVKARAP